MSRTRYSSGVFFVPARTWEANMASKLNRLRLYDSGVSPNGNRSRPGKIELYRESFPGESLFKKMNAKLNNTKSRVALRRTAKRRGLFCCMVILCRVECFACEAQFS